jgi:hypothetical protein
MKDKNWLERQVVKDSVEVKKHKNKLINEITSLNREDIGNTITTKTTENKGVIWRLKKVLGM